jgi:hypothetical protein
LPPNVWFAIPSAKSPADAQPFFDRWRDQGYKLAIFRQDGVDPDVQADMVLTGEYRGWPSMCNFMARAVLARFPETNCIVAGGDDMLPDPNLKAKEIEEQFLEHFHGTMGVMQPTGDRWDEYPNGLAASDRICGSPWMGREFVQRWNGGKGPFWHEYWHMYADESLREETIGKCLWQRRDLTHHHDHWLRMGRPRPYYLDLAQQRWDHDEALFRKRKAAGFPGHEPLPLAA